MPRSSLFLRHPAQLLGLLLVLVLLVPAGSAQDPTEPATLHITLLDLKPGYDDVWRQMHKDVMLPYFRRSSFPFTGVYRLRYADADYAIVMPIEARDLERKTTEAGSKRFRETARQVTSVATSYVQHKHVDLSYGEATDEPMPLLNVSHITIAPGRRGDFIKNMKANALPRWKKMGIPSITTWEVIYGDNSGEFIIVVPLENYSELTGGTPFYRGISESDRAQMLTGMEGVIVNIRRNIAEFQTELSLLRAE